MELANIERLVGELLGTGEMNEDTVADLERIVSEARAGDSYPDDLKYLQALHARILSPDRAIDADEASDDDVVAQLRAEVSRLQSELAVAKQMIAELEARLASGA
jgi:hypothetical protein